MAKRDTANLFLNVRRGKKQEALQGALLVPWRQLVESASAFAEWHMIILWVRVITETAELLPQIVRSELQARCPGFLECQGREQKDSLPVWKSLEEWVTGHQFATARAEGWFDALMYYAYVDLRTEQAWTTWERTKADWRQAAPVRWPTLEQWISEVLATRSLAVPDPKRLAPFTLSERWKCRVSTKLSPTCSNRARSHSGSTLSPNRDNPFRKRY